MRTGDYATILRVDLADQTQIIHAIIRRKQGNRWVYWDKQLGTTTEYISPDPASYVLLRGLHSLKAGPPMPESISLVDENPDTLRSIIYNHNLNYSHNKRCKVQIHISKP